MWKYFLMQTFVWIILFKSWNHKKIIYKKKKIIINEILKVNGDSLIKTIVIILKICILHDLIGDS